jgi:hypothetical protein
LIGQNQKVYIQRYWLFAQVSNRAEQCT